jgi:Fe-S cluster assembly protein SufD
MMARPKADPAALAALMAGLPAPAQGGWLAAAQAAGAARLAAMGLPLRRDEYWRYTDPAGFNAPLADPAQSSAEPGAFEGIERVRLVFVDGAFDAAASDDPAAAGVEIARLAVAGAADIHWARELHGAIEGAAHAAVARPFAALNAARAADGVVIRATRPARLPVEIVRRSAGGARDVLLRHLVRVDAGASLTLIETLQGGARALAVIEAEIGADAALHHIRLEPQSGAHLGQSHLHARLGDRATLKSFTLSGSARLVRNETVVDIRGDGAIAHVAGALVAGEGTLHDDTVFVTHAGVACESRQVFKRVLRDGAVGVFQGKILVRPGAQKTDGYQISQALLLDDASQSLAKPELEIYADDVKCSHGSTTGAIDETALFYLRSRGVPAAQAEALLVLAFLADAVAEIEDQALAAAVQGRLAGWFGQDVAD